MPLQPESARVFARITLFEFVGENDDTVVSAAPNDLPAGFADRTN